MNLRFLANKAQFINYGVGIGILGPKSLRIGLPTALKPGAVDTHISSPLAVARILFPLTFMEPRAFMNPIKGDALKKFNISLNKLITVLMSDGLSPLYGIPNSRWAHS